MQMSTDNFHCCPKELTAYQQHSAEDLRQYTRHPLLYSNSVLTYRNWPGGEGRDPPLD